MRQPSHTTSKLGPKCDRCGIPTMTTSKIMCDECAAHDEKIAAQIAAGWTGDDE